jgi:hypothetical protein
MKTRKISFIFYSLGLYSLGTFRNGNVDPNIYVLMLFLTIYFLRDFMISNKKLIKKNQDGNNTDNLSGTDSND